MSSHADLIRRSDAIPRRLDAQCRIRRSNGNVDLPRFLRIGPGGRVDGTDGGGAVWRSTGLYVSESSLARACA